MSKSKIVQNQAAPQDTALPSDELAKSFPRNPFRGLGLYGLDRIAPVLISALVSEEPLLLVGTHGTAKTLLMTRIAAALRLECRHYNASLLNFDDLVGFPLPDSEGGLRYVGTPASIWGAAAAIFDEISRCRPDIQNKLFPIIHERRAQGLSLKGLRYRWGAMNPPARDDDEDMESYTGSEPLDPALADRFAYIVEMPGWDQLSESERIAVITAKDTVISPDASQVLSRDVARTHVILQLVTDVMEAGVAEYVRILVDLLRQTKIMLSPRRAGMLYRSVLTTHAAALTLNPGAAPSDSAFLAVVCGLPQRAQGIEVPEIRILGAHREAWRLAGVKPGDPLRAILTAADPVDRFRLAVAAPNLPRGEFSSIIADTLAQLTPGAREACIVHLFETGSVGKLNAAVAEQAANIYRNVATPAAFSEAIYASHPRFKAWHRLKDLMSRLDPADPRQHLQANAMASLFAQRELASPEDSETAFATFAATDRRLGESLR